METKNYFSTDAAGNILPSATCYVYVAGTTDLATGLVNINGASLSNPFTAQPTGLVQFKAPNGEYDLRVTKSGRDFTIRIQCFDGVEFLKNFNESIDEYIDDKASVLAEPGKIVLGGENGKIDENWLPEDLLVNAKVMQDYSAIRAYTGKATGILLTKPGIEGRFYLDSEDTTSPDIAGVVVIDGLGRRWKRLFDGNVNVLWSGAKFDGVSDDTDLIQSSIDYVYSTGFGIVDLPAGTAVIRGTSKSLPVLLVTTGGVLNPTTTLTQSCLILRAGVWLNGKGVGATTLWAKDITNRAAVSMYEMDGGGLLNLTVRGGGGVATHVSDFSKMMANISICNLEIAESYGYGLGMQYGLYINNRIQKLWVHDTGQDAIDWKAKPRDSDGAIPYGNSLDTVLCERFGKTGADSSGFDVRGNVQVSNIVCKDFWVSGKNNRGGRFSCGTWSGFDHRIGSDRSSLCGFYFDSGKADGSGSCGLEIREAENVAISNGVITNCKDYGVFVNQSAGGNGVGKNANFTNINVVGTRGSAFASNEPGTSFVGCKAIQAEDRFAAELGNLAAGQTALVVARTFDPSIVTVTKNGSLLSLNSDYTITGTTQINLSVAALATDDFTVATPTAIGFDILASTARSATDALVSGCSTSTGVLTPLRVASACLATFSQAGNNFSGQNQLRFSVSGANLEAFGSAANINIELYPQGSGNVTLRSRGSRSLVADNPANSVNWLATTGSIAASSGGVGVILSSQGADSDIPLRVRAKGSSPVVMDSILQLRGLAFASLPAASSNNGNTVRVTDRNNRFATSDGTNWRWQDGSVAS